MTNDTCDKIAVDVKLASAMFTMSTRSFWRLVSSGKAPKPFKLGRRAVWRVSDLTAWAANGFPSRDGAQTVELREGAA